MSDDKHEETRRVPVVVREAEAALKSAIDQLDEQRSKIEALPDETTEDERKLAEGIFKDMQERVDRLNSQLERVLAVTKARASMPDIETELSEEKMPAGHVRTNEPLTYEDPVKGGKHFFFRDLVKSRVDNDHEAGERLARHQREMQVEKRDVTTADPGAGGFIPPVYLGERYVDAAKFGRPFADAVAKMPPPAAGQTLTIPRVATAPAVAVQATEAGAVNETDFDADTITASAVTIAGQNDVSVQAFDFTDPGFEEVVMRELVKSYNLTLDTQLLSGSGSSGQHRGLRNVASINTITFSSGNAAALLGQIYAAQSAIATNAPGYIANTVLMHPRRAAWMASHRDANSPLLQVLGYVFASGSQSNALADQVPDLRVIRDGNIATNLGSNTRNDEVYVLDPGECLLAEGPLRARVMSEVLSGTLQVRIQLYAYSWFFGGRRPATITQISGDGLTTPTFPST